MAAKLVAPRERLSRKISHSGHNLADSAKSDQPDKLGVTGSSPVLRLGYNARRPGRL